MQPGQIGDELWREPQALHTDGFPHSLQQLVMVNLCEPLLQLVATAGTHPTREEGGV